MKQSGLRLGNLTELIARLAVPRCKGLVAMLAGVHFHVERGPRDGKRDPWWLALLLAPFISVLWIPFFNRIEPQLWRIPFFFWHQFLWVAISAIVTALVYLKVSPKLRAIRQAHRESHRKQRDIHGLDCHYGIRRTPYARNGARFCWAAGIIVGITMVASLGFSTPVFPLQVGELTVPCYAALASVVNLAVAVALTMLLNIVHAARGGDDTVETDYQEVAS